MMEFLSPADDLQNQLWNACTAGNFALVKSLVENRSPFGLDVNWTDPQYGRTAFYRACSHGHVDIVQYLMGVEEVDIVKVQSEGATPFNIACQQGRANVVEVLMNDPRTDVTRRDARQRTPFFMAVKNGHVDVIRILLRDERTDPNGGASEGSTPFRMACMNGHFNAVELLLEDPRVDSDRAQTDGSGPLWVACQEGHLAVVQLLLGMIDRIKTQEKTKPGPFLWHSRTPAEQAHLLGHENIKTLLDQYELDKQKVRFQCLKELKLREKRASDLFALVIFFTDQFLELRKTPVANGDESETIAPSEFLRLQRFFRVSAKLPIELQMVLCNRAFTSPKDVIPTHYNEVALKRLVFHIINNP